MKRTEAGFSGFQVSDEAAEQNYERLDKATQDKDTDPMECMLVMLKMFGGLRIYRLWEDFLWTIS